ncbi:MAG TPA: hypothetical protein VJ824_00310 [Bacillota bacterium]|nr:hypothetical protein [Bacillota bacterium]
MGQAALFTPPAIHKSNIVIFPQYLAKNRLRNFAKTIQATFTIDKDGLVTLVNDVLEFHYQIFHKHIQLVEISLNSTSLIDAGRCLEFIRYESYLLQKPIYSAEMDDATLHFLQDQGFRLIDDEERHEVYGGFWEGERRKA